MDLSRYEKVKSSEYWDIYLELDRIGKRDISMVVVYKKYDRVMVCLLTEELYRVFFGVGEYDMVYKRSMVGKVR